MIALTPERTHVDILMRARDLYDGLIKHQVESDHFGECLVLDVESGDYEIDRDAVVAMERASRRFPEGKRFGLRIGYPAMGCIGGNAIRSSPMRLVDG